MMTGQEFNSQSLSHFRQGSYPIEFTDVTSAEDDDQFKPHKASLGSKCPKFKPPDATAPNLPSQTQNAETAFKDEENFFENNPSLMENVPSKTAAEIYNEFEEKVEEFEDIVHVVDQLEEPPDAETISDPEDENIAKDALEDGDEALDENGTNG